MFLHFTVANKCIKGKTPQKVRENVKSHHFQADLVNLVEIGSPAVQARVIPVIPGTFQLAVTMPQAFLGVKF